MIRRKWTTALSKQLMLLTGIACLGFSVEARRYQPEVVVSDPFIEMHTGPGRGYPVFYVAGQGDRVTVLKGRTDWYKIRTERGQEGWVSIHQMKSTLDLEGNEIDFGEDDLGDFARRRWEMGVVGGDFGGAAILTAYGGFALTPNISTQISASQILGDFSDGYILNANLSMYPFPEWRVSPFFNIGTGIINIEPQTTVVQAEDRKDEIVHVGIGADIYLSKRFIFRLEYKRNTVLTSRDDNEEINEWKAGFSVFL